MDNLVNNLGAIFGLYYIIFHPITIIIVILLFYFKNLFLSISVQELRINLKEINETLKNINKTLEINNLIQTASSKNKKEE